MQFTYIIFLALWEIKKVWNVWKCEKKGKCARDKSRGIELRKLSGPLWFGLSRFEFHVCAMCLWFWTTASIEWDIYIYIYIFFFFNGCLDSLVLSLSYSLMSCMWSLALISCDEAQIVILSCHVLSIVLLVFIYNILTIGFGTLCFMHLVSRCSLSIFLANFFQQVGSWVNSFLLEVKKKSGLGHVFFGSG